MGNNGEVTPVGNLKTQDVNLLTKTQYTFAYSLFAICFGIGLKLPDIDLFFSFLTHRSILTHNFLWPIFFICILLTISQSLTLSKATYFNHAISGLCIGLAIHLSFDLFPIGWKGYALISIPIYGRTSPLFSGLWIASNALFCLYLAIRNIFWFRYKFIISTFFAGGFLYSAASEPSNSIGALAFLLSFGIILFFMVKLYWKNKFKKLNIKTLSN